MADDNLAEKFNSARDLINKSKKDPPNDPYKSKYEAQDILLSLVQMVREKPNLENDGSDNRLAIIYYILGNVAYDVDELNAGNEYAKKALEILSDDPIHPDRMLCYISTLNILGYGACKYSKIEESLELLEKAETAYKSYKEKYDSEPKEFGCIFGKTLEGEVNGLEKTYTATLFYLAQVHASRHDRLKSARYCHITLKRQLALNDFDAIDWALNSATLSQYLIEQNAFKEARNHLATAQIILELQNSKINDSSDDSEEANSMKESLRHRTADVFRCWVKYASYLLTASRDRLLHSEGDSLDPVPLPPQELRGLLFSGFQDDLVKKCESSITSDFLLTFEDAKPVFLASQEWLNKAKEFYTLEDHASDHISILQDSSQLYLMLSFFHSDETVRCKMNKRRLDLLEKGVNELNPTFYMNICRELWYELGEICCTLADLKQSQGDKNNDQHLIEKSQNIYLKGIKFFEKYLDSFKLKNKNGSLEKYPEGFEKGIIMAYIFLGKLYSKLNSQDKGELLRTQSASLQSYRTVLDYYSFHKDSQERLAEVMCEELAICKEMVQLLPLKISKIERYM